MVEYTHNISKAFPYKHHKISLDSHTLAYSISIDERQQLHKMVHFQPSQGPGRPGPSSP